MTSRQTIGWSIILLSTLVALSLITLSIVWAINLKPVQTSFTTATVLPAILTRKQHKEQSVLMSPEFPELQAVESASFQEDGSKSASVHISCSLPFPVYSVLLLAIFIAAFPLHVCRIWLLKRALLL